MAEKIDINQADVMTLAALSGIGPKRAAKIVEYRTAVHPFEELIELAAVPGISERMVRELADQLTVGELETAITADLEPPESPLEEIDIVEGDDENEEAAEISDETDGQEMENETELAEELETAESAAETDAEPIIVTMLEPEPEQPEPEAGPERAVTQPPARPIERTVVETVPRRHSHLVQQFVGVIFGALFGSALTLLLLFLFNGTLRFADNEEVRDIQIQLDEETSGIRQAQSSMTEEMGNLTGRVAALDNEMAASNEGLEAVAGDVAGLESETAELSERLETIDLAAEKFDTFLIGMRDLLVSLQGLPDVPTATLTITATTTVSATLAPDATPISATPTATAVSPDGGSSGGAAPTRTPRPTATPLIEN